MHNAAAIADNYTAPIIPLIMHGNNLSHLYKNNSFKVPLVLLKSLNF